MQLRGDGRSITFGAFLAAQIVLATSVSAMEVQLAGIRLDAPWVTVLDVYGCPDAVVTYAGEAAAVGGGLAGEVTGGGMGGGMGGPMMGGGYPGGAAGAAGAADGWRSFAAAVTGGPSSSPSSNPLFRYTERGGAVMPPYIRQSAGGPAMPLPGGGGGPVGAASAGTQGAGSGAGGVPMWAQPVWVVLEGGEVEWFYRKGSVCLGFVFNRDGYVRVIAVAGDACDYARTSLWRPHRYVRLGDGLKRVLYRYGYPDEIEPFSADAGVGGGATAGTGGGGGMVGYVPAEPPGGDPAMPGVATAWNRWADASNAATRLTQTMGMGGGGATMGGGAAGGSAVGEITVTFNGNTNVLSRNAVVTYSDNNNIAFTLHDMQVTRICIWKAAQ